MQLRLRLVSYWNCFAEVTSHIMQKNTRTYENSTSTHRNEFSAENEHTQ